MKQLLLFGKQDNIGESSEDTFQATISPPLREKYMIRGFISCPGEPLEFLDSDSITISVYPADTDNDEFLDPIDDCTFAGGVSFLNVCPSYLYRK
ncbi:MAG: hypothetical protein MUQ71_08285 [Flavobacteriaceae bacterium]|nr:hypothetical protein [Flavobacteriaceae bacterium]